MFSESQPNIHLKPSPIRPCKQRIASVLQTASYQGGSEHDSATLPAPFSAGSGPIMPLPCTTLSGPRPFGQSFWCISIPYLSHLVVKPCSRCLRNHSIKTQQVETRWTWPVDKEPSSKNSFGMEIMLLSLKCWKIGQAARESRKFAPSDRCWSRIRCNSHTFYILHMLIWRHAGSIVLAALYYICRDSGHCMPLLQILAAAPTNHYILYLAIVRWILQHIATYQYLPVTFHRFIHMVLEELSSPRVISRKNDSEQEKQEPTRHGFFRLVRPSSF